MYAVVDTEGLYWSNYWQRYGDNNNNYNNYYYYDDYDDNAGEGTSSLRPSFIQTTTRNISVHRGRTARLCCQVEHLGSKTVYTLHVY